MHSKIRIHVWYQGIILQYLCVFHKQQVYQWYWYKDLRTIPAQCLRVRLHCVWVPGLTGPTLRCQAFATCLHKTRAVHPGNPQTSRQHTSLCADAHWTCPKKSDKLTGFAQRLGVHPPRCRHGLHGHLHALQNKLESRLMLQGLPAPVYRRFCLIATMTVLLWNCCWLPCLSLVRTSSQHSHVSSWIACQNGDGQYQKAQK